MTASSLDTTGTELNGGASTYPSSATISKSFTIGANSNLLLVEVDIRDISSSNPGLPSTITFLPSSGSTVTLSLIGSQNSNGGTWHDVGVYEATLTSSGSSVGGTIVCSSGGNGIAASGNLSNYGITAISLSGVPSGDHPIIASADVGNSTTNTLAVPGVQSGDFACIVAASGPSTNDNVQTLSASSGTTMTATVGIGAYSGNGNMNNNNFTTGYVSGLSAGTATFTATQGSTNPSTGGKFVFLVVDIPVTAQAETTWTQSQLHQLLDGSNNQTTRTRPDYSGYQGGVPLGGIGAGTVEWHQDGSFRQWQIFNNWGNLYENDQGGYNSALSYDLLNAFAAVKINNSAYVLETSPAQSLPGVGSIAYTGTFPFCKMTYTIPGSPVTVSSEGFGAYIPHDPNDSATPAIGLTWNFTNTSASPVTVSLALSVVNPLGTDCAQVTTAGSLAAAQSTHAGEGLAVAALDGTPTSILGGADTAATLSSFWSAFTSTNPVFPPNATGQRIGQMVTFTIAPGTSQTERFVVGWYFPTYYEAGTSTFVGHQYSAWTNSPAASVNLLASQFATLRTASLSWVNNLLNSSWPSWITNWLVNSQSTIAKNTWWTQVGTTQIGSTQYTGHFMNYESPDLPNGSPVHVFDMADWPVLDSFPSLELELVTHNAAVALSSGQINEEFNGSAGAPQPGITYPGGRSYLVDINPKWVLEVYHRWRETGNRSFLDTNFPAVVAAMKANRSFDTLGEGMPNGSSVESTWDHWNDTYSFSYAGSVQLAADQAFFQLFQVENDTKPADVAVYNNIQSDFTKAQAFMNSVLWNGSFYAMTTNAPSSGVTTTNQTQDGLSFVESTYGDDLAGFIGLPGGLPNSNVLATLRNVVSLNNDPTSWGLVVSANTSGQMVEYNGDGRSQITTCHAMPAPIALIQRGNATDQANGLRVLQQTYAIQNNSDSNGIYTIWNLPHHVVAASGVRNSDDFSHYLRDRVLWSLMKVLNGWIYDAPDLALTVGPIMNPQQCNGPWSCSTADGNLAQTVAQATQTVVLNGVSGTLTLNKLNVLSQIGSSVGSVTAALNNSAIATTFTQSGNQTQVAFTAPMNLAAGSTLSIQLALSGTVTAAVSSATSVPINTNGFTATGLSLNLSLAYAPSSGDVLTVVNNTGSNPIAGTFTNLPNNGYIAASFGGTTYAFQANYAGGDGNDLVLTYLASGIPPASTDTPVMPAWGLPLLTGLLFFLASRHSGRLKPS